MREKPLATSDESGILNAPALNPLRRVLFFPGILVYNSHASLNNWHLLRQQRQPMAHKTKFHNSDTALAIRHGRRSHAFKTDWYQHPPCTEEQAEWLIHNYRRRGYEIKKALSLDYRHWIIYVRLPYSERPPRPSRTFQQRIWR